MADAAPADPPPADPPPADPPPADPPPADPPPAISYFANENIPDTWRSDIAGEDTARLNHLERVSDFGALVDNYFVGRDKIRSGEIAAAAPPDEHSTEEEWKDYRTEHNIPTKAEDYEIELAEGLVLGDDDKEVLDLVYPVAHKHNLSSAVVSDLTNALLDGQAQQYHGIEIQQEEFRKEADALVKKAWKGEYETNINLIQNGLLNSLPESVREEFAHATLADGRKVFNSPEMLIGMAEWARKLNPAGTVIPNTANPMQAIATELEDLEKRMSDADWHNDTAAQARYMQLVEARDNLKNQG